MGSLQIGMWTLRTICDHMGVKGLEKHCAHWGRSRSVDQPLCSFPLSPDPHFPGSGTSFSVCPFQDRTEEKVSPQAPRLSAVFSNQLSFSLLPPTASHRQPNIEYGKQEKQQQCKVTLLRENSILGTAPCLPSLLNCQILQQVALLISVPWRSCLTNRYFFGFKNST